MAIRTGRGKRKCKCNCNCRGAGTRLCCEFSNLRGQGIKATPTRGVYFADANLVCTFQCTGVDSDIIYEWQLFPISGNPRIEGSPIKIGNDRVTVSGAGQFILKVRVTFRCRLGTTFVDCPKEATVQFTQASVTRKRR